MCTNRRKKKMVLEYSMLVRLMCLGLCSLLWSLSPLFLLGFLFLPFWFLSLKVSVCCSRKVVQDKDELSCYVKVKGVVAYESMLLNREW